MTMQRIPSNDAQNEFQFVMDQVCAGLGPVLITGMKGDAVLVCEEDWRLLHRKLEALLIPALQDSTVDQIERIVQAHTGGAAARD
jgi:PHD/YefM family antitoxin component YafN of YafNO toxin-antitoxin module